MIRALYVVVLLSVSSTVAALTLTPSSYELQPSGSKSSYVFEVGNSIGSMIAVQVEVKTRSLDSQGREVNADASGLFELFPAQILLEPNQKKKLRVRWLGDKRIPSEKAFRLVLTQLPVNFTGEQTGGVKVMHKVVGALYVTPRGAKSKLTVVKSYKKDGRLNFTVKNEGAKHSLLSEYRVQAVANTIEPISALQFQALPTQNVLAGSMLEVDLPWPLGLEGPLKAVQLK